MTDPANRPDSEPLGADAAEPLDRADLLAAWDETCSRPTPAYTDDDVRRGDRMRWRVG